MKKTTSQPYKYTFKSLLNLISIITAYTALALGVPTFFFIGLLFGNDLNGIMKAVAWLIIIAFTAFFVMFLGWLILHLMESREDI